MGNDIGHEKMGVETGKIEKAIVGIVHYRKAVFDFPSGGRKSVWEKVRREDAQIRELIYTNRN